MGARKIAILQLILGCIAWLGQTHFVPEATREFNYFILNLATWLLEGGMTWLTYLALEPEVRSRWPHALMAWNRALAGRWKDSQVGWHLLIGCALGMLMRYAYLVLQAVSEKPGDKMDLISLTIALDLRHWIGYFAERGREALVNGLATFLLIFGLRQLCKREWLAASLAAILLTAVQIVSSQNDLRIAVPFFFVAYFIIIGGLLRFGLVTASVLLFTANATLNSPAGTDFNAWYNSSALMVLVLIGALAVFGFWRSQEGFAAK